MPKGKSEKQPARAGAVGKRMARGSRTRFVERSPVAALIGYELVSSEDGRSLMVLEASERHANPMGTLHGGVLCDIADEAMGWALISTLEEEESFTTLELKINYLRPVWDAKLSAHGRVVNRSRRVALVECEVRDEQERLIARATSTCMVLRGEDAKGR